MKRSKQIALWIRYHVRATGKKGVVVGLSGGIDSAVVAYLCAIAVGAKNVLCLTLPCESSTEDEKYARCAARHRGLKIRKLNMDRVFRLFVGKLGKGSGLAAANLKARLRMCALYYYANSLDYLVAGTGNKSELTVGYFTKYGDGGVDILPIGGILKRDVRRLAREIRIPGDIISRPPSAGLWKGQTDEGEMGIGYEDLDAAISAIETGQTRGIPRWQLNMVKRAARTARHKKGPFLFAANSKKKRLNLNW